MACCVQENTTRRYAEAEEPRADQSQPSTANVPPQARADQSQPSTADVPRQAPLSIAESVQTDRTRPTRRYKSFPLPSKAIEALKTWLVQHVRHPYPTTEDKVALARTTGLQYAQASSHFAPAPSGMAWRLSKSHADQPSGPAGK
jgi:hypothetical protein